MISVYMYGKRNETVGNRHQSRSTGIVVNTYDVVYVVSNTNDELITYQIASSKYRTRRISTGQVEHQRELTSILQSERSAQQKSAENWHGTLI